jgi:putative transposase
MNKNIHLSFPVRKRPARQGFSTPRLSEFIFITCCTRGKIRALDNDKAHQILVSLWGDRTHWIVYRYVIMPDHIHLIVFASSKCSISLRGWARWWKSQATKALGYKQTTLWLPDIWDTRIRSADHLESKQAYMLENPVRAKLVESADSWPFQGKLFDSRPSY